MGCAMRAYRVEKVVSKDGTVHLEALPFTAGEVVEIIVLANDKKRGNTKYPLKGTVLRYDDPTKPVAQDDWEALQ